MNFVIVFAKLVNAGSKVLVVRKDRPAWQAGRLNLPGGKIEDGETPLQCAVRELKEEAGLEPVGEATLSGAITGSWGTVYCVKVPVMSTEIVQGEGETEHVFWTDWHDIKDDPYLMPNLRVVIPLFMASATDWVIIDDGVSWDKKLHTFSITVNSMEESNG